MNKIRLYTVILVGLFAFAVSVPLQAQKKTTELLTNKQVKELVTQAKTPAEHMKLNKHFLALAAKYEADAADHVDLAQAYRNNPNASESKRPGSPDTAAHCDRFADLARQSAKEARDLAVAHAHMAEATK